MCSTVNCHVSFMLRQTKTPHIVMSTSVQESIKASSAWFHACALHAAGMAAMILQRAHQLPAFEPQLHLLFLVNDIFFTGCGATYFIVARGECAEHLQMLLTAA